LRKITRLILFLLCLAPLFSLAYKAATIGLSANPIDDVTDTTGTWTLRFLIITLTVSPFRQITKWNEVIRYRRMFGLFAFFYVTLHFLTYVWLDQFFDFSEIYKDVLQRPFITIGFSAFCLMIPLAITSTNYMVRKLGGKRWQLLHRLIYPSAIGGVIHYIWLVKADTKRPMIYGAILSLLLGYRLIHKTLKKNS